MSNEYDWLFKRCSDVIDEIDTIVEFSEENRNQKYSKYIEHLRTIALFIKLSTDKLQIVAAHAYRYDFDDRTKANGYRSILMLFSKILDKLFVNVSKINLPGDKYTKIHRKRKFNKEWMNVLIGCYPLFCIANLTHTASPDCLFVNKRHALNTLMNSHASSFVFEAFYGDNFGFQYNSRIQKLVIFIANYFASFASGFDFSKNKFVQAVVAFGNNGYYFLQPKKRRKKLKEIFSHPTIEFCKSFMSLLEYYGIHQLASIVGNSVSTNQVVKIKLKPLQVKSRANPDTKINLFLDYKGDKYIEVHLISLKYHHGQQKLGNKSIIAPTVYPNHDHLIIYVHGGGFVALSSKTSELILRKWANVFDCPIVSINYTLSPEAVFPQAVNECFYIYCWILANSINFGSTAKKIVLIGDSAGANLILAVTQKAIVEGVRIPDGCVCAYPICYTSAVLAPSRLMCNFDMFLSTGFVYVARDSYFNQLKTTDNKKSTIQRQISLSSKEPLHDLTIMSFAKYLCMDPQSFKYYPTNYTDFEFQPDIEDPIQSQVYLIEEDPSENPLASPYLTPEHVLKQFPPVRMILVDTDPLLDDGIEFSKKLKANKVNIAVDIVRDLPHGFLNLHFLTAETLIAFDIVASRIKELFIQV